VTVADVNVSAIGGATLPGGVGVQFEWKDKRPPFYWTILAALFLLALFLWVSFDFIVPHIGSRAPDSHHVRAFSVYGGTYYVQPWAAWFHDSGGWILGSFFFALVIIQFVKGVYLPRAR
jgi:hypothetical protein